ncbi:MAG: NifB/NifX family molybdenum-iron cluster-binding protein [Candidatus Omnitrophota bacterium]
MKICITSQGDNLESQVDPHFGRCQYFIIVNPDTLEFEAIKNPNIDSSGGAGIQSGQLISEKLAEIVITGNVGPNAFNTLKAGGIRVITGASGKIKEIIEQYKNNKFKTIDKPNVTSHFGMS